MRPENRHAPAHGVPIRRTSTLIALFVAALPTRALAQPPAWALSAEMDPFTPGAVARDDLPIFSHVGGPLAASGIAIVGWNRHTLLLLGEDGLPLGPERALAPGAALAVGTSTYLRQDLAGAGCTREALDPAGGPSDACPGAGTTSRALAIDDDYVLVGAGIDFWPAGAPASEAVHTSVASSCSSCPGCGPCDIDAMACHTARCAVVLTQNDTNTLFELDPRAAALTPVPVGLPSLPNIVRLYATDDGWVVTTTLGSAPSSVTFYDATWTPGLTFTGSITDCSGQACFGALPGSTVSWRFTSAGMAPLPSSQRPTVCSTRVCIAPHPLSAPTTFTGFDIVSGAPISMPDGLWLSAIETTPISLGTVGGQSWFRADVRSTPGARPTVPLGTAPVDPSPSPPALDYPIWALTAGAEAWVGLDGSNAHVFDAAFAPIATADLSAWCPLVVGIAPSADGWWLACATTSPDSPTTVVAIDGTGTATPLGTWESTGVGTALVEESGRAVLCAHGPPPHCEIIDPLAPETRIALPTSRYYPGLHGLGRWVGIDASPRSLLATIRGLDGSVIGGPTALAPVLGAPGSVAGAFDGTYFLVAWSEDAGPSLGGRYWYSRTNHLARLTIDGELVEDGVVLTPPARVDGVHYPSTPTFVTSDGSGHSWIAYTREIDDELGVLNMRVRVRSITTGDALGSACTDTTTCGSGRCVHGVCCSRTCDGACDVCTVAEGARFEGVCTTSAACVVADAGLADEGGVEADGAVSDDAGRDAAIPDAATTSDAASQDGAIRFDAGARVTDADRSFDAGPPDASTWIARGGACDCHAGRSPRRSGAPSAVALGLVALALRRKHRWRIAA